MTGSGTADPGLPQAAAATNATGHAHPMVSDVLGILDTIDVPLVVVGQDCKVTRFNRAATEALGINTSDLGRQVRNMIALSRFQNIEQLCARAMIDGIASRHDIRHDDGWYLLHIAPRTGADRQVLGAVLTFTNVTAFRASIARAVYEREYTKAILNMVVDPLVVLDEALQVQTANRAFYDWFGVSREKAQGVSLANLGDQAWKAGELWPALKATVSGSHRFQTVELDRDFPNGGRRIVLLDADRLVRDGNSLVLVAFRDITGRKHTEHALRQSEARLRMLFGSMDEGYCVIEMVFDTNNKPVDYRFVETNPAFERQTGIKDAEGRLMREIAPEHEQHWFDIYGRVALTGETVRFEKPATALRRYYHVCAFRVGAPDLHLVGIVFTDITSRKDTADDR